MTGTRLTAEQIHDNVKEPAEEELKRPALSLMISALSAGLLIGFSLLASAYLSHHAPRHLKPMMTALGYPLGFLFVVLGRSELFTEQTLRPVIPLLIKRDAHTLSRMLRFWALLLIGNLVGALIIAWAIAQTGMIEGELRPALERAARDATSGGFASILYRAIFGGWLIALLAWLLSATYSTGAQILLVWLCTMPIAAFKFAHSIAGAVDAFYLAWRELEPWGDALGGFLIPAVIGNVIGGVTLVALLNYGQVRAARRKL